MSTLKIKTEDTEHFERCLTYALKKLAIYQPFFMYALYNLKIYPVATDMAAFGYTDGRDIAICYPIARTLVEEEFAGLVQHELLHILNLHLPRRKDRSPLVWNLACDISVNGSIDTDAKNNEGKIVIRKAAIRSPSIAHLSCEDIYERILKGECSNVRVSPGEDSGDTQSFNVEIKNPSTGEWQELQDEPDMVSGIDIDELSEEQRRLLRESRTAYPGTTPAGIERKTIELLDEVKVDWRKVLRRYIAKKSADYSFTKSDRRFQGHEFFIPGVESTSRGSLKISVGIDLSGSIALADVQKMLTECIAIERQFDSVEFTFTPFDVDTYGKFTAKTKKEVFDAFNSFKGGGGTSFVKVLRELDTKDTLVILMFTDLYGQFPDNKPKADVIWLDIGDYKHPVPFGKIIKYDHSR